MDELGIEKERKGILKRWFCSRGKKYGLELTKRRSGCTGVFLFAGLSGVALLWNDVLGREIGDFCG